MKDTKTCWNCGKETLEPYDEVGHDWLKCSNCGATEELNPTTPGAFTDIVIDSGVGDTHSHYRPVFHSVSGRPPLSEETRKAKAKAKRAGHPIY